MWTDIIAMVNKGLVETYHGPARSFSVVWKKTKKLNGIYVHAAYFMQEAAHVKLSYLK